MANEKSGWWSRLFSRGKTPEEAPAAPSSTWAVGARVLDDFQVERLLGEGGMGAVYLVRSTTGGQRFAVKKTLLHNPDARRDFLAELQTWIDLPEHPHLAACRFFRTVGDEVVVFAEYVDGGDLSRWIRERRLTTLEQILDVAIQFAWGLDAAHEHGLIHQDAGQCASHCRRDCQGGGLRPRAGAGPKRCGGHGGRQTKHSGERGGDDAGVLLAGAGRGKAA